MCRMLPLLRAIAPSWLASQPDAWTRTYVRQVASADFTVAVVAAAVAAGLRFGGSVNNRYVLLSLALPVLWLIAVRVAGGYEKRFLGAARMNTASY